MNLTDQEIDLLDLISGTADDAAGALVVFAGTVRNHHEGEAVEAITYSAYAPLAEKALRELERETLSRFPIQRCRIVHRTGRLGVGDASVVVVVRSAHRGDAFDAARYAIDTLKVRVPVWKQDHFPDGRTGYQEGQPLQEPD